MNLRLAIGLAAMTLLACGDDETLAPAATCPNEVPVNGAPCPAPGLVCNYFTNCGQYWPATCEDGAWRFEDGCVPPGTGGQGQGGAPTTTTTTTATTTSTTTTTTTSTGSAGGGFGGAGGR